MESTLTKEIKVFVLSDSSNNILREKLIHRFSEPDIVPIIYVGLILIYYAYKYDKSRQKNEKYKEKLKR